MTQASAADRKQVRAAQKAAKVDVQQRLDVIRSILSTRQGRWWLYDKLIACHCYQTSFTGEALSSAFAEGERNIGNQLLAEVMLASPSQYLLMMEEAHERNAIAEQRRSENSGRDAEGPSDSAVGDYSDEDAGPDSDDRGASAEGTGLVDYGAESRRINGA